VSRPIPWCKCGQQHKSGYANLHDGTDRWVCAACRKPTRLVFLTSPEWAAEATSYREPIDATVSEPQRLGSLIEVREENILKVSNSELRAFKRCRRKWWLAYFLRLRAKRDGVGALSIGNMVHAPLEAYYALPDRDPETFQWEPILAAHVQARLQDDRLPQEKHPAMLEDYELAKIMLRGYFEWLTAEGIDSEFRVLAAEEEIEAFLGDISGTPVWLIGKLDTVVEILSSGLRTFWDHKTVADMKRLPALGAKDEQFMTYGLLQRLRAAARLEGRTDEQFADGGSWNMLRKVKRTARSNPPYYERAIVRHNDTVYRNFYTRVWGEVTDMLAVRTNLEAGVSHHQAAYPNPTMDCSWDCPFVAICPQFDDGSDVQSVLTIDFEQHDPYERYVEVEKG
jgi:hypothetical protein